MASRHANSARQALRILVADDERDTVATMLTLLRDEGHEALGVQDSAQVLKAARDFRPHAVILDIGMPKLTGYDLARKLRDEHGKACPVLIAVTAYDKTTDRLIGKAVGFDHYFGKPAPLAELFDVLAGIASQDGASS